MSAKYMAYVGSYSYTGKAKGITVYDVDAVNGTFKERCEVEVNNSSYLIASADGKTLYSIADEGIVSFRILDNGALQRLGVANIRGMRGCHLSIDQKGEYIMVSGYHDAKATVLRLREDGSVGEIVDGVFHKGIGSVAERTFRPHVSCTRMTDDQKYVLVSDLGIDQVRIYRFDRSEGKLRQVDAIRCELESAPRHFRFSPDRRFLYLMYELKNVIEVYSFDDSSRTPKFEKIQTISTHNDKSGNPNIAACALRGSKDAEMKHLFCSNAGIDTVSIYERDVKTGLLEMKSSLPIAGEYPKDMCVFPDGKHLVVANHYSGSLTFFSVDYEHGLLVMSSREQSINEPNCICMVKLPAKR